jgi:glycosyltransferase involved in cell wall biosynthesis
VKILLAAAQFSSHISGLQRHAFNLVRCLLKQQEISSVHFVLAPWQRELARDAGLHSMDRVTINVADMDQSLLSRHLWYYRHLPRLAAEIKPDVIHLSYPVPVDVSAIAYPTVLTLHDLYPYEIPGNFGFPKAFFNRFILQQCLRSVDAVACVSDVTVLRMKQFTTKSIWGKAVRIYNCVESEQVRVEQSPIMGWHGEPFLLSVSQHRKNKNIPLLIRVFYRLLHDGLIHKGMKLAIIGIVGPETARICQLVSELRLGEQVYFLQGLSEPALQWCYTHCEALVAPSETEGFGLPVAEALLAGCRVICSDIPSFREIDEDHCRFVPLGSDAEEKFAAAIVASLNQSPTPPISLPQFSSEVLGAQYLNLYRRLSSSTEHLRAAQSATSVRIPAPERQSL